VNDNLNNNTEKKAPILNIYDDDYKFDTLELSDNAKEDRIKSTESPKVNLSTHFFEKKENPSETSEMPNLEQKKVSEKKITIHTILTSNDNYPNENIKENSMNTYNYSSVKPKKGDITPKSNISNLNDNNSKHIDKVNTLFKDTSPDHDNNKLADHSHSHTHNKFDGNYFQQNSKDLKFFSSEISENNKNKSNITPIKQKSNEANYITNNSEDSNNLKDISISSNSEELIKKLKEKIAGGGGQGNNDNAIVLTDKNMSNDKNKSAPQKKNILGQGAKKEENIDYNFDSKNISDHPPKSSKHHPDKEEEHVNYATVNTNFTTGKIKSNNSKAKYQNKNYEKFDLKSLEYELIKEYVHTKIPLKESFMQRMLFDVFKRQTKDKRLKNVIEKNKLKLSEFERVQAFNRLIEDANRRLEACEKLDTMKTNLATDGSVRRSCNYKEWKSIYEERFSSYKKSKEEILQKKIIQKEKEMKDEEDKIIDELNSKIKKAPQNYVNKLVQRLYEDAERRKIVLEEKEKQIDTDNMIEVPSSVNARPNNELDVLKAFKCKTEPDFYKMNKRKKRNKEEIKVGKVNKNKNQVKKKSKSKKY
jgi:hypothetical protein